MPWNEVWHTTAKLNISCILRGWRNLSREVVLLDIGGTHQDAKLPEVRYLLVVGSQYMQMDVRLLA
jgi:hypothetical protein